MRVLIPSNAPWVHSGYGVQTKYIAPRLAKLGHEVAVHCLYGLDGGSITWDGIKCYPRGDHPFGQDVMAAHAAHFGADVILTLIDVWVVDPRGLPSRARWSPWFPADHEPLPEKVAAKLRAATLPIAMSQFGVASAKAAGIEAAYAPLCVDLKAFRPKTMAEARRATNLPGDAFIVGMVAANRDFPSRKGFPEAFQAFARFRQEAPGAILYVHAESGPHPNVPSVDLIALADACGVAGSVVFADPYAMTMGCTEDHLADLYSSFDLLLCPSHGEGFGVPLIEAQACGCPVAVGEWTAMGELCGAGWTLTRDDAERVWSPLGSWRYSPRVDAIVAVLRDAFVRRGERPAQAEAARAFASRYDADKVVAERWPAILRAIEEAPPGRSS